MVTFKKLIFVCRSNETLSIMAEAIMNHLMESMVPEDRVMVVSRGLVVLFSEPINPKAKAVIAANGMTLLRENSRALSREDITPESIIITMNEKEKHMVEEKYPGTMNLYQLRDFSGEGGELFEPYGGSDEDLETIFDHLDLMIKLMVEKLWKKTT